MRLAPRLLCLLLASGLAATIARTQAPSAKPPGTPAEPTETNRLVAGGGISVPGWQGKIDADSEKQGQTVNDAKLAPEPAVAPPAKSDGTPKTVTYSRFIRVSDPMRVTTGPPVTYWNPKNVAGGDYTVSATFTEPKFMNLNDHPHPYGIVIAGNDLGTAQQSLLYCAAYGNGTFIVRGFGPAAFQMGGRRPTPSDAVHKAPGVGEPVTQDIAMSVKGDSVTCSINGTVVATYTSADLVVPGKLKSLDGVYGIRFAHNTEAVVTNLKLTKP
jgi:hypothetical protein